MKRVVVFVFVIFLLLMTACASSPHWSGAETANGEFVWTQSPGIRFYVHVVLLGGIVIYLGIVVIKGLLDLKKDDSPGFGGIGCLTILLLLFGLALWGNVHRSIWHESFSINQERIEHISYSPVVWKAEKNTETLEWKNVTGFRYAPEKIFESTTLVKVNPVTRERVGDGQREEGLKGRAVVFKGQNRELVFALEKQSFGKDFGAVFDWIFGDEDYAFSPEEERCLKEVINKYLPEKVKEAAPTDTKEYMNRQE